MQIPRPFILFLKRIGVDKSIAYSSCSKINSALSGLITILFIAKFLTEEEQGFYYTFGSIVALQVFFELGLTNILTQFVAKENAALVWDGTRIINKGSRNHSRIAHLERFTIKWYLIISSLFLIILLILGYCFFSKYSTKVDTTLWLGPWTLITLATAGNLFVSPFISILAGLDRIKETSKLSFYISLLNPIVIWLSFIFGLGLFAPGLGFLTTFILTILIIRFSHLWAVLKESYTIEVKERINYKKEIYPYQWRIALSWASGYFVFQLFNPILFAFSGPVVAGQMGMTLTAINGVASLSASWISTKVPLFSKLIALRDYTQLDRIFKTTFKQLFLICSALLLIFTLGIVIIRLYDLNIANRFLPILPMIFLELAVLANHCGNCWAVYLRCHLKEPLLINAIVGAIACGISTIFLGKYYGAMGMSAGYCIIRIVLSQWTFAVFRRKKNEWHSLENSPL